MLGGRFGLRATLTADFPSERIAARAARAASTRAALDAGATLGAARRHVGNRHALIAKLVIHAFSATLLWRHVVALPLTFCHPQRRVNMSLKLHLFRVYWYKSIPLTY
jgi:hypothetical protein